MSMNQFGRQRDSLQRDLAATPIDQLTGWRNRLMRTVEAIEAEILRRKELPQQRKEETHGHP